MADTIVNAPGREYSSGNDMASWVVALAIITVLVLGAVYLLPRLSSRAAPETPSNINVTLPANTGAGAETGGTVNTGGTGATQ